MEREYVVPQVVEDRVADASDILNDLFDNRTEVSTRDYRLHAKRHGIDSVDAMDHFFDLQALGRF